MTKATKSVKSVKSSAPMFTIEDGMLVIRMPMAKNPQPSSTGKTLSIASTHGDVKTGLEVGGKELTVGLNAYVRAQDR